MGQRLHSCCIVPSIVDLFHLAFSLTHILKTQDPFANAVVKARFPEVIHLGSVSEVTKESIPEQVDLIVGGFPCQDLSFMGNQRG
jgi:hypothetical protein